MRKTLGKKEIIRKRLEISNGEAIKKQVYNQIRKTKENNNIKKVKLSTAQKNRVNAEINKALKKSGKNKAVNIIAGGSRFDRSLIRSGVGVSKQKKVNVIFKNYGKYDDHKKQVVDYDIIFCVSSYNRYEKIKRILEQIFSQKTNYTFKFILTNDGSTENIEEYDILQYQYPNIDYIKNNVSGGKLNYWKTVNFMWERVKNKYNTHGIIQIDDDFILCDNFLDKLMDTFFEVKNKSNDYMAFNFHLYNFNKNKPLENWWRDERELFVDGGTLYDIQFLEKINFKLDNIEHRVTDLTSTYTWVRIKERLIEFGMKVYRTSKSFVWHDGNDDSKFHGRVRKTKRVYTKNFIDENIVNYVQ